MKALVKRERERGLWLEDVPEPDIGINDVLIKVDRTGICGTDVHIYNWDAWAQKTIPVPMVVGHEFVGEIVEIGANVADFHPGDIVSGEGHVVCGRCRNCLAGRRHLCADTKGIGVNRPGAFAEYHRAADDQCLAPRPGDRSRRRIDLRSFRQRRSHGASFPVLGEDVLITGAGPIGCMAAAVAKHAGARYVVVTDVNPYRLELGRENGSHTHRRCSRQKSIADVQKELGMKEGFDVGLEMSGNADAFRDMLDNMCHGGKIAMLGIPSEEMAIDWNTVVFNMLTIKGIYGREMYETWYKMTVMIQSGLDITPVITHRFHYHGFRAGIRGDAVGRLRQSASWNGGDSRRLAIASNGMLASSTQFLQRLQMPLRSENIYGNAARSVQRALQVRTHHHHAARCSDPCRARQAVLNLCANNYLGLADHPEVDRGGPRGTRRAGVTALSSVRFICGTQDDPQAAGSRSSASSWEPKTRSSTRPASTPTADCSRRC